MNFIIQNHRILQVTDPQNGTCEDFCEEICVTTVKVNLLEGSETVDIVVYSKNGMNEIRDLPRGEIASRGIIRLLVNYGLTLPDNQEVLSAVQYILFESALQAPAEYYHDKLGFFEVDGRYAYLAHNPVGVQDVNKLESVYMEPKKTNGKGTLDSWLKMIDEEVVGNVNLELGLALGFTAPVAHLLKRNGAIANLPVWGLIGPSSTGKTITLRLAASIYGSPDETSGIIMDCNATENAFVAMLEDFQGFPILIDEATNHGLKMSSLLYDLAKGQAKRRCKSDGKLKEANNFSGAVMISSERSLITSDSKTEGLFVRLQEFTLPWTNDAEHAHRLEVGLSQNYGTAIYPLAEWLLKNEKSLSKALEQEYEKFRELVDVSNGIEDRLIEKYSIILVSARALKKVLGINLNLTGLRSLLFSLHKQNLPQVSRAERTYNELINLVGLNNSRFFNSKSSSPGSVDGCNIWGEYTTYKGVPCVWINARKFRDFMKDSGESSTDRVLLTQLEQEGWLVRFGDRYSTNHRVGTLTSGKYYCLILPLSSASAVPPKGKQKNPSELHKKELLDEENV